jgi:hypothetical protein
MGACEPPSSTDPVLLVVGSSDPALFVRKAEIEEKLRRVAEGRLAFVPTDVAERAIRGEGGQTDREQTLVKARVLVQRAEEQFRELNDEPALDLIAKATANLASVHQEEGAVELLARAHLLAAAIYLARDRLPAAKNRLQRALDLDPKLQPDPHRFSPRVLTELAALRAAESARPVGALEVRLRNESLAASVFVDGRHRGETPLVLDAIGEGRHLLRVWAPGYQSYIASIAVAGARRRIERVNLTPDREIREIIELPRKLRGGGDPSPTLALLAKRAEVERAILASLVLSDARTTSGEAAIGVELFIPEAGRAFASTSDEATIRGALERALACDDSGPKPSDRAPSSIGMGGVIVRPAPVPEERAWWNQPWFFGVAAAVVLVAAGGVIAARAAQGPPEVVEVTLIPRP